MPRVSLTLRSSCSLWPSHGREEGRSQKQAEQGSQTSLGCCLAPRPTVASHWIHSTAWREGELPPSPCHRLTYWGSGRPGAKIWPQAFLKSHVPLIQPVHPKGNQSWIFIGRTDAEAEAPVLWPPNAKNWHIGKDPDAGKDWRQEEKGTTGRWEGWIASLTWWTWVWASTGNWWWTGKPGVLQTMGSQRVGYDWATEMNFCLLELWGTYGVKSWFHRESVG